MKITFVGAVGIAAVVVLAILLIQHLHNQKNGGRQPGRVQEPSSSD